MTTKASRGRFIGQHLSNGDRVAVQLTDGTLVEGYWYDGQLHDEPPGSGSANPHFGRGDRTEPWQIQLRAAFWPNRPPAPWRIWPVNREWRIEKRVGDGYETWCRFDTSAEAFAAFAAGSAR
ncbi:hypothetical protein PP613_03810 [Mycobacteroides abscessus]|nr:hypothetical protein [Mycobacteroides abscessus]MDM2408475.1 hypothetical protein [Mycobacteroides abscessus]